MEFTKEEIKNLEKYYKKKFEFSSEKPNGKDIDHLVVISHGNREKHDSGYPFIKIIGIGKDEKFYDLGWHDHFCSYVGLNVDSLGKNVFRIMKWCGKKRWRVAEHFISVSSFMIGNTEDLLGENQEDYIELGS